MHWVYKDTASWKQIFFSENALGSLLSKDSLFSNVSDALSLVLLPADKFSMTFIDLINIYQGIF